MQSLAVRICQAIFDAASMSSLFGSVLTRVAFIITRGRRPEALASGKEDQARIANILHYCHLTH